MSARTPGAWRVLENCGRTEIRPSHPVDGFSTGFAPIAVVRADKRIVSPERMQANALLLAVAPELLESLQELVAAVWAVGERPGDPTPEEEAMFDSAQRSRMVIAKATGGEV